MKRVAMMALANTVLVYVLLLMLGWIFHILGQWIGWDLMSYLFDELFGFYNALRFIFIYFLIRFYSLYSLHRFLSGK